MATAGLEPPKKKFLPSASAPANPTPDINAANDFIKEVIAKVQPVPQSKPAPVFVKGSQIPLQVKAEPVDISLSSWTASQSASIPGLSASASNFHQPTFPLTRTSLPLATDSKGQAKQPLSLLSAPIPAIPAPPAPSYKIPFSSPQSPLAPTSSASFGTYIPSFGTPTQPFSTPIPSGTPTLPLSTPTAAFRGTFPVAAAPTPSFTGSSTSAFRGFPDNGEKKKLKTELWDVRRDLQQGVSREASIVKDLNKSREYFDKPLVPTYGAIPDIHAKQASELKGESRRNYQLNLPPKQSLSELTARMDTLQKQLEEERKARLDSESLKRDLLEERRLRKEGEDALRGEIAALKEDLEEEKRLRKEGEGVLQDIRREMTHPFIVPQLLDALVSISKLSSHVVKS